MWVESKSCWMLGSVLGNGAQVRISQAYDPPHSISKGLVLFVLGDNPPGASQSTACSPSCFQVPIQDLEPPTHLGGLQEAG